MADSISARFREHLRKSNYSIAYHNGPRFECVKRRGHKTEWLLGGAPISEQAARERMKELDTERRP
ncbi:MAG: hypothetical protein HOZ81_04760 [Streptomyces sp.]|nr:hypothetical protein [Streptomyces sp.]